MIISKNELLQCEWIKKFILLEKKPDYYKAA